MLLKIILTILFSILILRLVVQFAKSRIGGIHFFFFLCIWSGAMFFTWQYPALEALGERLGLRQVTNLIIYAGLILAVYYVFVSAVKFYKIEQDINKLVTKDAINEFKRKYNITDEH